VPAVAQQQTVVLRIAGGAFQANVGQGVGGAIARRR
jgi:hypothetical protein